MKSSMTKLITGTAVAALLALPASVGAQTPPSQPQTQPPATAHPSAQPSDAAREHLSKAKAALDDVNTATLSARQKQQIADVKKRMNTLERTVASNDTASATGAANRNPKATSGARGNANWGTEIAAIDKSLNALLGAESATGAPAATGTSGAPPAAKSAAAPLDETTRTKLLEVRTHLTAFATAMAGGDTAATPTSDPKTEPTATNPSAANPPASTTPPAATTPTPAPQTAPPASTTPQPTGTSGTTQAPQAAAPAQADDQAARRLLTDARNTLSELTQLPAASQLTGETRTQVAQLISNFNELITSQAEWRASYAKVNASLTALIGPDPGAVDPSNASGTAGAVGTSGAGASNLDPAIRAKLVDLRRQLSEFEKAAGGTAASTPSAAATDPNAAAPTQPTSNPPSSTPPPATPPSSNPPSATPPPSTPPSTPPTTEPQSTTPSTAAPAGTSGAQAAGNADVFRHIAAIEAMLKLEDDSGGLTLTKAQVEQLRAHVAALRQALDKK